MNTNEKTIIKINAKKVETIDTDTLDKLMRARSASTKDVAYILGCTEEDAEELMLSCPTALLKYKTTRVRPLEFYRQILRATDIKALRAFINSITRIPLEYYEGRIDAFFNLGDYFEFVDVNDIEK